MLKVYHGRTKSNICRKEFECVQVATESWFWGCSRNMSNNEDEIVEVKEAVQKLEIKGTAAEVNIP